jgi:hypothetical protein
LTVFYFFLFQNDIRGCNNFWWKRIKLLPLFGIHSFSIQFTVYRLSKPQKLFRFFLYVFNGILQASKTTLHINATFTRISQKRSFNVCTNSVIFFLIMQLFLLVVLPLFRAGLSKWVINFKWEHYDVYYPHSDCYSHKNSIKKTLFSICEDFPQYNIRIDL